jgi:hypothetical protein
MADQDPKAGIVAPATADTTKGGRLPEDELADIEAKEDARLKADEAHKAAGEEETSPEVDEEASVAKLSEFMRKKGINDVGKLVDIAAEFESKNTKLAQEVARLSAVQRYPAGPGGVQAGGPSGRASATVDEGIVLPENPIDLVTSPGALKKLVDQLDARADARAEARLAQREQERTFGDVAARVQAKMDANPEEFVRLRPIMFDLSKANPNADIDQLYAAAKAQYVTERKSLVEEIRKDLGLTGNETERLKAIVGRIRQAPISGGTGVQIKPGESKTAKEDADLLKAIANADKF